MKQAETSPAEVLGRIFTKYQELLWKQGLEREYLRVGFSAPLFEDIGVASHGFISEASSLVSIFALVFSIHLKVSHFMLPTSVSGSHVYPAFTFAVCGCVRFSIILGIPPLQ